jgi:hypothetical protein
MACFHTTVATGFYWRSEKNSQCLDSAWGVFVPPANRMDKKPWRRLRAVACAPGLPHRCLGMGGPGALAF